MWCTHVPDFPDNKILRSGSLPGATQVLTAQLVCSGADIAVDLRQGSCTQRQVVEIVVLLHVERQRIVSARSKRCVNNTIICMEHRWNTVGREGGTKYSETNPVPVFQFHSKT